MKDQSNQSVITGIMLTTGSAIGAGMFSLPVVSSGMWFLPSLICLIVIWYLNYLAAIYLLEINIQFSQGASFDTFVDKILGKTWNVLTGLSIAFVMYILLYAYFSAFGNMASHALEWEIFENNNWSQGAMSLIIGFFLAAVIWWSTAFVGHISTILVLGMILTFIVSMFGLALQVETVKLFDQGGKETDYFSYLWAALPYFMTSFGFVSIVPSLYKHYGKDTSTISKGLWYGSLLTLGVYTLFIFVSFGNISREAFVTINSAGGNIGDLVNGFEQNKDNTTFNFTLNIFSNFAIITSFLGVGLGLFDYIADKFSFPENAKGRFYAACLTFMPPGIASFFFPHGFIAAIGYAGLVMIFGFFLVPFLMIKKTRQLQIPKTYQVWGGNALLTLFISGSFLIGGCKILTILGYLPTW